ncbi:DUF1254 domain-containing protein [Lysobacter sp. KIS68-7]|uniref:DUF1254 domain-containing protein n=1 Tax=Lysobacter sp. KIS68-7 TaxID=2904252 RepID=UPI001E4EBA19|nr:DUF1254 domain-containing protein [Lysobacter sp. KIS68-7]UHQ19823.1 DUF1254 domain-containing protein [Lysobacter sp. KIS68-7]
MPTIASSTRRLCATVLATALLVAIAGCNRNAAPEAGTPAPSAAEATRTDEIRELARDAYIWGFPIVDNYRVMDAYVLDPKNAEYKGPFNTIANNARLYTPQDKAIQTPNSDTPYSMVWMDLRAEPVVLTVPKIGKPRYYSIQLIDAYTHNTGYIGSRTTGNDAGHYLIAGPGWTGDKPPGIKQVFPMETQFVFAVYRTQLFGAKDMDNIKRIQVGYKVQPLSAFLGKPTPPAAPAVDWMKPVSAEEQRTSLEFFNELAFAIQFIPTHPAAKRFRERLAEVGFVPGRHFDFDKADPTVREAMLAGMQEGQATIDAERKKRVSSMGLFGTREDMHYDPVARALGAQVGIYANSPEEAMYSTYEKDADGQALDGAHRYVLRFPKGGLPPAKGFWSLTMYGLPDQLLVDNPIDRYLINSTMLDTLKRDPDGGITLYLQNASPDKDKEANWLPAPQGRFFAVLRNYWPDASVVKGDWKAPQLQRAE